LPSEVNEAVVDRFMDYRSRAGTTAADAFRRPTDALWISSTTGGAMTTKNLGTLISKITLETLGVDVSPHLFRTAAASTAAAYGSHTPHLASAVLGHNDPRVAEEHYNRASSMNVSKIYADIINSYL